MDEKKTEWVQSFVLGGIVALVILIIVGGFATTALNTVTTTYISFYETEHFPQGAEILSLTDEDYEQFPELKSIPETILVDTSLLSSVFTAEGHIDRVRGELLLETYSGPYRYLEHNGVIYHMSAPIS